MKSMETMAVAALAVFAITPALAQEWQFNGFIRDETAFATSDAADPFNQNGNQYNGVPTPRDGIYPDIATRDGKSPSGNTVNLEMLRGELDTTGRFGEDWSFVGRLRVVGDPGFYNNFSPGDINSNAVGDYQGKPSYFGYTVYGDGHPNPLEFAGQNYMIDTPSLFVEYNHGPLDVRVGNQQIAWGQAIFFRVLDVPDGLDYRRHSVLDYVPEEYSDKRIPALAVRASYQISENWLADGYVQKFQPTVYSNANTPYNFIASQFTIRDDYAQYNADFDEGIRVKGQIGDVGVQAIYAHRYNPDGVYSWTKSGVDRDIPGLPGSGKVLENTPFEVSPAGVWSASEWFQYAAMSRLNGVAGLNASITDFEPYTGLLGAAPVPNMAYARKELDTFFQLAGGAELGQNDAGLIGHLAREYRQENDIGGGLSYVTQGAPGSPLDQLILNGEVLYVPDRTFTAPSLDTSFIEKPEVTAVLAAEKYQRFSSSFPATYFVAQFFYKSQSDLFGRYLGGMGGTETSLPNGYGGGFKAVAFAFQQPFPNLIWRLDFAALYDLKGGLLLQPALRWKPNGRFTVEAFYNYINGRLGNNQNNNIFGNIQFANEVTLRLGYQF
jgi:hypothetical protein